MTINTTVLPESGGASPAMRAVPTAISAAGVNDTGALARQQLVNAVPAPALVPAYASNVAPPPKPPAKPVLGAPSSALAAQFIGQLPEMAAQDLEIFTARTPAPTIAEYVAQGDDFLAAMRIARGDIPAPAAPQPAAARMNAASTQQQDANTQQAVATAQATTLAAAKDGSLRVSLATSLPALLTPATRPVTLSRARGVGAYQLAETRNAATPKTATPESL